MTAVSQLFMGSFYNVSIEEARHRNLEKWKYFDRGDFNVMGITGQDKYSDELYISVQTNYGSSYKKFARSSLKWNWLLRKKQEVSF